MADKGEAWKDYFRAACTQEGIIINGETILDTQGVDEKWQDNLRAACTPAGIKVVGSAQAKLYDELGQHTDGALTQKCATNNILDKQKKLIPGANINLDGDGNISAVDTTYSVFTGATSGAAGTSGLVPAPAAGDNGKCLMGDGSWKASYSIYSPKVNPDVGGSIYLGRLNTGGSQTQDPQSSGSTRRYFWALPFENFIGPDTPGGNSINILGTQRTGTGYNVTLLGKTTAQNCISIGEQCKTEAMYSVAIGGYNCKVSPAGGGGVAIGGSGAEVTASDGVAIGQNAKATHSDSIALGYSAQTTRQYELNIRYNGSSAGQEHDRYIGGVADGVNNNDAATVGQLNNKVDKVTGKSLSTNDFTDTLKTKLDGIEEGAEVNDPDTVVDAAYVHTDNNFTSADKTKLDGIEAGAEVNEPVDTALDASSSNAIANSAVTNALNNKITVTDTDPGEGASLAANQFIAVYEA